MFSLAASAQKTSEAVSGISSREAETKNVGEAAGAVKRTVSAIIEAWPRARNFRAELNYLS